MNVPNELYLSTDFIVPKIYRYKRTLRPNGTLMEILESFVGDQGNKGVVDLT